MIKLWQLKKLSDGSALSAPQPLPENWGPVFGMAGIADRLGDLSWLGEAYNDMGWVVVEEVAPPEQPEQSVPVAEPTAEELAWSKAKKLLAESDWAMMVDVPMTSPQKSAWIAYRRALRDIRSHPQFPNMEWPVRPE